MRNPGSRQALDTGCLCPVTDNHHGKGIPYTTPDGTTKFAFWTRGDCPVHGKADTKE